jgi:hypothetical protein
MLGTNAPVIENAAPSFVPLSVAATVPEGMLENEPVTLHTESPSIVDVSRPSLSVEVDRVSAILMVSVSPSLSSVVVEDIPCSVGAGAFKARVLHSSHSPFEPVELPHEHAVLVIVVCRSRFTNRLPCERCRLSSVAAFPVGSDLR